MSDDARQFMMMVGVVIIVFIPATYRVFLVVSDAVQRRTRDIGRTQAAPGRAWFAEALAGPRTRGYAVPSLADDQVPAQRRHRPGSRSRIGSHAQRDMPDIPLDWIERDAGWEDHGRST